MSDSDKAFAIVVGVEKGYVVDQGGPTMYGVTEAVARANGYVGDMHDLPLGFAQNIFKIKYWDQVKGDQLPWPLSLFVADCAYNQGVFAATKIMQRALGTVADGHIGSVTLRLAAQSSLWHAQRFMAFRAKAYMTYRDFNTDGDGWLTRLFIVAMQS